MRLMENDFTVNMVKKQLQEAAQVSRKDSFIYKIIELCGQTHTENINELAAMVFEQIQQRKISFELTKVKDIEVNKIRNLLVANERGKVIEHLLPFNRLDESESELFSDEFMTSSEEDN